MSSTTLQCLLVDEDRRQCELLQSYLGGAGLRVDAVHSGPAGLNACLQRRYDVVLANVALPQLDGLDLLAQIRRECAVPVIMLTEKGCEADRIEALDRGADDCVTKPFSGRELVSRIRALLRRARAGAAPGTVEVGDLKIRAGDNRVVIGDAEIRLTFVEANALRCLCASAGAPVSRRQLYRDVLRRESQPYDRSLDTHMSNLRRKLGRHQDGRPRIYAVRGHGYQYAM